MKRVLTIGIPTYYAAPSLVETVRSIRSSAEGQAALIIVSVDGRPLDRKIKKDLLRLHARIIENKIRGGQVARIRQIISLTHTEFLILTQDDVVFDSHAIGRILSSFRTHPEITMIGAHITPYASHCWFETVVAVGVRLTHRIGDLWNHGDNYLLASGRCLAFRTHTAALFSLSERIINSDACLYFENKRHGGKFLAVPDALVFNASPKTLNEHLKQSRKFQMSYDELSRYTPSAVKEEYHVPLSILIRSVLTELVLHPASCIAYGFLSLHTHIFGKNLYSHATRFWDTDVSTKRVIKV